MTQDSPEERTQQTETDSVPAADPLVGEGLLDEEMGPSSSMAHLYRGEIHRMKFWRERLDRTTNWAVVVISALLTWSFSSTNTPHYVILIGIATLTVFLVVEARRYRGYDIWRTRVRSLQQNVFAKGLDPSVELSNPNWRTELASDYRQPTLKITTEEAIAHRLRRIYLPLFGLLLVAAVSQQFDVLGTLLVQVFRQVLLVLGLGAVTHPVVGLVEVLVVAHGHTPQRRDATDSDNTCHRRGNGRCSASRRDRSRENRAERSAGGAERNRSQDGRGRRISTVVPASVVTFRLPSRLVTIQ